MLRNDVLTWIEYAKNDIEVAIREMDISFHSGFWKAAHLPAYVLSGSNISMFNQIEPFTKNSLGFCIV